MPVTSKPFSCEVAKSPDDQAGNKVTTVTCHGRITADSVTELRAVIKPLIPLGGRIIVDLADVQFVDSSGLGTFIALKVSAINQGLCMLEYIHMNSRVLELLRMTRLERLLTS
jgi:anti-anti-sigma factor